VLFTRHSDKVLIDSTPDGKVVLFNHNNLLKCSLGVFTGIDFELGSGVGFFLTTVLGEPVEFLYWNHGIVGRCADNQLYRFHREKQKKAKEEGLYSESIKKGFMTEGAWKYVRHPNFISEQLIWISFYLFGVAASGQWINYTLAGPVLLVLLFYGSSRLTESISRRKYPEYEVYQKEVPKFIPLKFNRSK